MAHAESASGTLRTVRNVTGLRDILGSRQRPAGTRTPARAWDRWLLAAIYGGLNHANVRLRLWDGTSCGPAEPVATVVIHDRGALFSLAWQPDIAFGDGYASGRIDVDGDLVALLEALFRAKPDAEPAQIDDWVRRVLVSPNALHRSRDNIHHHYDIGNEFYQLWLDGEMVYTCAYFPTPAATLEEAQIAKMDHVCRKLRLRPGERVVEAGCGWGALALHMARATACTCARSTSRASRFDYARERARREGLGGRVEFIEDDYRNIARQCDAFVSVGMLEHVGRDNYPALGRVIDRVLAPDAAAACCTPSAATAGADASAGSSAHLPRRVSADAGGDARAIFEPARPLGARRREPAPALRAHAAALARALRAASRRGDARCSTSVRAHVAAVPGGLDRGFNTGIAAAVPGVVRARPQQQHRRGRGRISTTMKRGLRRAGREACDVADRRRRARRLDVRPRAARAGARRGHPRQGARSRATRSAPAGSRRAVVDALELDRSTTIATAACFQPITAFAPRASARRGAAGRRRRATRSTPVSYGIRRCEFDHFLLQRSGARVRPAKPLTSLRRDGDAGGAGSSTERSSRRW